ncbi:UDP-N-acetylmuramate dehydrogenase [Geobacter sp. DSM 9736]|uniref:UDP-N-acetylmuramate dehydrogenase n=1 Tax=Geobacter sp. DSM 9736 TaxID=1277350 RepID=UPI000B6177A6|nr:UDP-N-acetylmuramate dehydrogenase [Geobacter sp. DSM 9736]
MTSELERELRREFRGELLAGESLARHTSLKVGGPADLFAIPADEADLLILMAFISAAGKAYFVIGGGYNLLVRDGGFPGVVISLRKLDRLEYLKDGCITAGAGVGNLPLARFAEQHKRTGLEFISGIPGTVGGALAVNAGAHDAALLDRVVTLTTLLDRKKRVRARAELEYGYRFLSLEPGEIILGANFHAPEGKREEIRERMSACQAHRRSAQAVTLPNAGSFFKNPTGMQAWRLIDQAGLRGAKVGGAQVSEAHANFLVNAGGATAADFIQLAALIKERVKALLGVELEEEVRIVGTD